MSEHTAENVASLDQGRAKRNESLPAPGTPAITFGMDEDAITFRDQAALDEYVAGAILEHSRYHGGGVDECSSDPASPCVRSRVIPPAVRDTDSAGEVAVPRVDSVVGLEAESGPSPAGPVCPECVQGKHQNCRGDAWDDVADAPTVCTCPDEEHR